MFWDVPWNADGWMDKGATENVPVPGFIHDLPGPNMLVVLGMPKSAQKINPESPVWTSELVQT